VTGRLAVEIRQWCFPLRAFIDGIVRVNLLELQADGSKLAKLQCCGGLNRMANCEICAYASDLIHLRVDSGGLSVYSDDAPKLYLYSRIIKQGANGWPKQDPQLVLGHNDRQTGTIRVKLSRYPIIPRLQLYMILAKRGLRSEWWGM